MPTMRTAKHLLRESTTKSVESGTYEVISKFARYGRGIRGIESTKLRFEQIKLACAL